LATLISAPQFNVQELALSSKPGLMGAIEELEKMTAGLKEALKEEVTSSAAEARTKALSEAEAGERSSARLAMPAAMRHMHAFPPCSTSV
jgi:hypothetical protein